MNGDGAVNRNGAYSDVNVSHVSAPLPPPPPPPLPYTPPLDLDNYIQKDLHFTCVQCNLSSLNQASYMLHIKQTHCVEVYRCILCKQMQLFDNLSLLKEHFFQVHAAFAILYYLLFVLDFRVVWIAIRNYQVMVNVSLSIILFIGLSSMWNFDERSLIGINVVLVTIFISITDALPPDLRNLIGLPVLIILEVTLFTGLILVVMNRLPLNNSPILNLLCLFYKR